MPISLLRLDGRQVEPDQPWSVYGYLRGVPKSGSDGLTRLIGWTTSRKDHPSPFRHEAPEEPTWVPGAGVFVFGKLVGVVIQARESGHLKIIPVSRIIQEAWFWESVGLLDSHEDVWNAVQVLQTAISKHLDDKQSDVLRHLLVTHLELPKKEQGYSSRELAQTMVRACALPVLSALDEARSKISDPAERVLLRQLLVKVLPYAIDWHTTLIEAKRRPHAHRLEIAYATETIAEVIMAGVEERDCRFRIVEDLGLVGIGLIEVPTSESAPILATVENRIDGLVQQIAPLVEVRKSVFSLGSDFLREAVKTKLKDSATRPDSERGQLYLVVRTDDDTWALAAPEVNRALRHLHLVRLTAGAESFGVEGDLAEKMERIQQSADEDPS